MRKATNQKIARDFLEKRVQGCIAKGYQKQKWVEFCEAMMERGYTLTLYEARRTVSKYITVHNGDHKFKVRFSNHKPIRDRKANGDCDFFVGKTHLNWSTTAQAIAAVDAFMAERKASA